MVEYDLGMVKGPKGDKGDTGAQGPQGEKGDTGATGPQGEKGDIGPQGDKGDTGPIGPKGDTGATGPQGPKGDTGAQGPAGPKGDKGDTGPQGEKGPKGDTGTIIMDTILSTTSTNAVQNQAIARAVNGKANTTHTHTTSEITDFPVIPDVSNYIQKSSTSGLVKNDGSIDSNDYVTSQELPSKTSDLINDSSFTTLQAVYPVGSIYMSVNTVSPSILFGFGVWEKIEDKFLLASGATYVNGSTGGSPDAVIVSHSHKPNVDGEYIVTSEEDTANNTKVAYSASGNRWVDGQTSQSHFHHRTSTSTVGEDGTGKNMPPYLAVNIWKRVE